MEESIYTYVSKFPEFESIISTNYAFTSGNEEATCKSFKQGEFKEYIDQEVSFLEGCTKIANKHEDIIKKAKSSQIALCKYINYWIYGMLNSSKKDSHGKLLKDFYEKVTNLSFCGDYKKFINDSTYKELKELYDLYEYFNKFKNASKKTGTGSCEVADKFFELYEQYAGKCKWKHNNPFCWELIKIGVDYEMHMTHATKCTDKIRYLTRIGNDSFTSFDAWLLSKLPGAKKKTKKKVRRMHEFQRTSEIEGRRYKLPYHSS